MRQPTMNRSALAFFLAAWLVILLAPSACVIVRREADSQAAESPQGRETGLNPQAWAVLNSILTAAKRLAPEELASRVSEDYNDSRGRSREELLQAFRLDQERFATADVTVRNPYSQEEEASTLLRFEFSWRGIPRGEGAEERLEGRAEWTFKEERGNLKLASTREDTFLGVSGPR